MTCSSTHYHHCCTGKPTRINCSTWICLARINGLSIGRNVKGLLYKIVLLMPLEKPFDCMVQGVGILQNCRMEGPVESKNIFSDNHFADNGTDFLTQDELEVSVFIPLRWLSSNFRLRLRKIARKFRPNDNSIVITSSSVITGSIVITCRCCCLETSSSCS